MQRSKFCVPEIPVRERAIFPPSDYLELSTLFCFNLTSLVTERNGIATRGSLWSSLRHLAGEFADDPVRMLGGPLCGTELRLPDALRHHHLLRGGNAEGFAAIRLLQQTGEENQLDHRQVHRG